MNAIVFVAGRQYKVSQGQTVKVDLLPNEVGSKVSLDDVRLVSNGDKVEIGTPKTDYVVNCNVVEHSRKRKVMVVRFARRGGMRRTKGHRQHYTVLKVTSIEKSK